MNFIKQLFPSKASPNDQENISIKPSHLKNEIHHATSSFSQNHFTENSVPQSKNLYDYVAYHLEKKKEELQVSEIKRAELEKILCSLNQENKKLNDNLKDSFAEFQKNLKDLTSENQKLSQQKNDNELSFKLSLSEFEKTTKESQQKIQTLINENEDLKVSLKLLQCDHQKSINENEKLSKNIQKTEEALSNIKQSHEKALENHKRQVFSLESQIESLSTIHMSLKREFESQITLNSLEISNLKKTQNEMTQSNMDLMSTLNDIQSSHKKLLDNNTSLKAKLQEKEDLINMGINYANDTIQKNEMKVKKDFIKIAEEKNALKKQNQDFTHQIKIITRENEELKKKVDESAQEIEEISRKCKNCKEMKRKVTETETSLQKNKQCFEKGKNIMGNKWKFSLEGKLCDVFIKIFTFLMLKCKLEVRTMDKYLEGFLDDGLSSIHLIEKADALINESVFK